MKVANPLHGDPSKRLITGQIRRPDARLADKIVNAIDAKAAKKHDSKEKTVLILPLTSTSRDTIWTRSSLRPCKTKASCPTLSHGGRAWIKMIV